MSDGENVPRGALQEKCDQCGIVGRLGPDIRAYSFETPSGKKVVRFLHGIDSGKDCSAKYHDKYRAYMREQLARGRKPEASGIRAGLPAERGEGGNGAPASGAVEGRGEVVEGGA